MTEIEYKKFFKKIRKLFPSKKQNYKGYMQGTHVYPLEVIYLDRKKSIQIKARLIENGKEINLFNQTSLINENVYDLFQKLYDFLPINCHMKEVYYRLISKCITHVLKKNKPKKQKQPKVLKELLQKQVCYIMKDDSTSLYKIGKSNNPRIREKTLQSEKPSIKLINVFSENIEKELHDRYKRQRIRGEWFNLSKIQIKYICSNYR